MTEGADMWITLALSMTYMLQLDASTVLEDPPTRGRLELVQAAQERFVERWKHRTSDRSKSILSRVLHGYSILLFEGGLVNHFPAEYLHWSDVLRPLRRADYMPDFVRGVEPAKSFPMHMFIHLQYSQEQYRPPFEDIDYRPPAEVMAWIPDGTDQLTESLFAYLVMGPPTDGDLMWVTSQPSGLGLTRACIVIKRVVSDQSTGKLGLLRSVETRVLVKDAKKRKSYSWSRKDSTWQVGPLKRFLGLHGAEVPNAQEEQTTVPEGKEEQTTVPTSR